ncbi:hypothetical protein P692DRAFT_20878524 [Suillus brevipes Sb2]|nr:hypothetical protein P692DRAFT_20878524 [Suillus brevipes Sb2]
MTTLTVVQTSYVCYTPLRHHETTTNSTPQDIPQPFMTTLKSKASTDAKPATPVFRVRPPGNRDGTVSTTTISKSRTSLPPGICEAENNKKLPQDSVVLAAATTNFLFDSDDDNLHYHLSLRLTSMGRRILEEISKGNPGTGRVMEFHGVGTREYHTLQSILDESSRVKPRRVLTYDHIKHVLLVDMPSPVHEAPFTKLKDAFASTLKLFPYNHKLINPDVNMNLELKVKGRSVTPDISITMMKASGLINQLLVPLIGECACSDTVANALGRMKNTIRNHPEVAVAILAVVREVKVYECPQEGSVASETLSTSETPMPLEEFITEEFPLGEPIKIAGHDWFHLRSVEYTVWVKKEGQAQIDFDDHDEEHIARGMLFPEVNMGPVMTMIQRGLEKIKDMFIAFTQRLDDTADVTRLKEAEVIFSMDWDDTVSFMNGAAHTTSYARYLNWLIDVQAETEPQQIISGKRIRDPSYSPSPEVSDDAASKEVSTISRGRPKRRQCPASQPPPLKSKFTHTQASRKRRG